MINKKIISLVVTTLLLGSASYAQGQGKQFGKTDTSTSSELSEKSNIGYLKQNHASYSQDGSSLIPSATKDATKMSIDWTIESQTEEQASKLAEHINFMVKKLEEGENPKPGDKLFLMEAYMKVNHAYVTSVEYSGTSVVISKVAKTSCAYDVIAAHSDAVSGDFFGQGVTNINYSAIAEEILASTSCDTERNAITAYIEENIDNEKEKKGHGKKGHGKKHR